MTFYSFLIQNIIYLTYKYFCESVTDFLPSDKLIYRGAPLLKTYPFNQFIAESRGRCRTEIKKASLNNICLHFDFWIEEDKRRCSVLGLVVGSFSATPMLVCIFI